MFSPSRRSSLYFALARFVISNSRISIVEQRKPSDYEARPPLPVSRPTGRLANAHDANQPSAGKQTAEGWKALRGSRLLYSHPGLKSNGNLDDRMIREAHGPVGFKTLGVCACSGEERRPRLGAWLLLAEFLLLQHLAHPPGDRRRRIDISDRPWCRFLD